MKKEKINYIKVFKFNSIEYIYFILNYLKNKLQQKNMYITMID